MIDKRSRCVSTLDGFALLALVTTFLLRYAPFLTSHLLFGPFRDNVYIYGPIFAAVSRLSLSGSVPYYLPNIGTGFPLFQSAHFSILYPFYFFGLINYGGPLASLYTLTNVTLFHILVFYINLYVLLRCATVTPWASYLGASVGMLATNTVRYASWLPMTASCAWLPLVLGGAVLLVRYPGAAAGVIVLSAAAGLLTLASPSQVVIHAAFMCLILFAVAITWLCLQRRFTDVWRVVRSLFVCSIIVLGLAGAAILPAYLARDQVIRHVGVAGAVIGFGQIPWESFTAFPLGLSQAVGIVIRPTWIGIVGSPYIGPLGLIGVLLPGIYFRRLQPVIRMLAVAFGIMALYGLFSSFGTNLGFAYINYHLPLINQIREPGRHLFLFVIGVSFLSGLGYSILPRIFEQYKQSRRARPLIPAAMLMVVFSIIVVWELFQASDTTYPNFWMVALVPTLYMLGHICGLPGYRHVASAAVLVSAAAVVIPVPGSPISTSEFSTPINLLSHKVLQNFANKIDARGYRVDFRDKVFSPQLWAMNASYYGMKSFYNRITPQPYAQFRFSLMTSVPHLCTMMGARYVLCGPNSSPTDGDAREILETEGYRLYENSNAMGRLTLVHRVAGSSNSKGDFLNIVSKGFDYFAEAYVAPEDFDAVRGFLSSSPQRYQDKIVTVSDKPNWNCSMVNSNSASLLIFNEWFTPAWKARVNGKNQAVLRVNQWQTGVLLNAGQNRVEFEYRPTLFRALVLVSRFTTVLLLIVIFNVIRKHRLTVRSYAKLQDESG